MLILARLIDILNHGRGPFFDDFEYLNLLCICGRLFN